MLKMKNFTKLFTVLITLCLTTPLVAQVTNGNDSGAGSLRDEIANATAGDEITFGILVTNVNLDSEIVIDKELTITGPLLGVTIDADNNSRIFNITSGPVILDGLTLTNGTAEDGGALYITNSSVTINNSTISNSTANGASGSGGGIFVDTGGTLAVSDSEISGNLANRAGGGIEDNSGAGLDIIIQDVLFENNNAGVSPATAAPGNGGALHVTGPGDVAITSSTFNGNIAAAEGGGLWNGSGEMTIDDTTIDGNTASGNDADQGGGGVYNLSGTLIITNGTIISNNTADGASGSGGGILNDVGATLTVEDSEISENSARRAGGGIEDNSGAGTTVTLNNVALNDNETTTAPGNGGGLHITGDGDADIFESTVNNNIAAAEGGGLWNGAGTMTIENTLIDGNSAFGNDADQGGGGIYNLSGIVTITGGTVISNNIADGTSGSGGGILNDVGATLTIENSEISGNTSNRAGGGIEDNSGVASSVTLTGVDLIDNETMTMPGNGGGLHISGDGNITIADSFVANNTAGQEGGGLWNSVGIMTITNSEIDGNIALGNDADDGGAGVFNNGGTLNISDATIISNNTATGTSASGGGLLSIDGVVTITDVSFDGNSANRAGGAIEIVDGTLDFVTSEMINNDVNDVAGTANPGNGGGLHITGMNSTVTINEATIQGNIAGNEGGGLWNQVGTTMNINKTTIDANIANGAGGGGVYNNGGDTNIDQSVLSSNNATTDVGGGILNNVGILDIRRSTLSANTAATDGGGLFNNATATVNAVTITLNTAVVNGGGINGVANTQVKNSIIAENAAGSGVDVDGLFVSNDYNLIGTDDTNSFPEMANDIEEVTVLLGPLSDNGGDTFTHELLEGSPGIDAGDPSDIFTDQRSFTIVNTRDIGAYERGGVLGITDAELNNISTLYPNPNNGTFTIEIASSVTGIINYQVISISGRIIKNATLTTGTNRIDMSLPTGMYLVNIEVDGARSTHKMLINK